MKRNATRSSHSAFGLQPDSRRATAPRRGFRIVLAVAWAILLTTGCSFNRAWKRAASSPVPPGEITGRWEGTWRSEVNGHTGQLRCLLTRDEAGGYSARYHATYHQVLTFTYSVPLQVAREGDAFHIQGEENLGWYAGGIYSYEGNVTATNFFSTYRSKYDHGTFQLARPMDGR